TEAPPVALCVDQFGAAAARAALFVGSSAPTPTALTLGLPASERIRAVNPRAHICFFGLYAWLKRGYLLGHVADSIVGGEVEGPLVQWVPAVLDGGAAQPVPGVATARHDSPPSLNRPPLPLPLPW